MDLKMANGPCFLRVWPVEGLAWHMARRAVPTCVTLGAMPRPQPGAHMSARHSTLSVGPPSHTGPSI
jgi:hypothetical protein